MVATSGAFGDLLEPGLRAIHTDQFKMKPEMVPMLFNVQPATKSYEKDSSVGSFGQMGVFKGTIEYDDVTQGYDTTYQFVELAKGFKVERALYDDDLYGIISKKPRGLARAAYYTKETHGASVFNNAFSGSGTITMDGVTILNNSEGLSLCNSAHTSTKISDTQDNAGSTALSATSVEATRQAMTAFTDDAGNKISVIPDLLLVPRYLEETAFEIIATKGKVDSAENNENFHYGRYQLAVWDFLSSNTAWFMIASDEAKDALNWYDRIPLEFFQSKDSDTLIAKYANYARWGFGWSDWRWIYGHNA